MKRKCVLPAFVAVVLCCGCAEPKDDLTSIDPVVYIADMHCEAVALRKARFQLADSMRFMHDTIMLPETGEERRQKLQQRLDGLEPYKDSIVKRSLTLADHIRTELDSIIHDELEVGEERDRFDRELSELLKERGCE